MCQSVSKDFVAKIQNPSIPDFRFKGSTILFLHDLVDDDEDETLHCLV